MLGPSPGADDDEATRDASNRPGGDKNKPLKGRDNHYSRQNEALVKRNSTLEAELAEQEDVAKAAEDRYVCI